MKKVVVVALLLGIVCGAALAANTISISKLGGEPLEWDPAVNDNDINMTTATTYNLPLSSSAYRVHVGLPYGMSSLRIDIPITLEQDLFPGQSPISTTVTLATLTGQVDKCTYFSVSSNLEMNLIPTAAVPEPGGLLVLCSGLASLVGFTIRRRR